MCVYTYIIHTYTRIYIYTHIYLKSPWLFSKCPPPWKYHHVGCQFKIGFHENPQANPMSVTSLVLGKVPRPKAAHRRKGLWFQTGVHTGWEGVAAGAGSWMITFQSVHRRRSGQSGQGLLSPYACILPLARQRLLTWQTVPPYFHPALDAKKAKKQGGIIPRH